MRPHILSVALVTLALLATPPAASAVPFDGKPKIVLHVISTTSKNPCTAGSLTDCQNAVTAGQLWNRQTETPAYYVCLLAVLGNFPNVGGIQCGVTYQAGLPGNILDRRGIDIFYWGLCATLQFESGGWPAPGSGNLVTWDETNHCQTGEASVAGYFYLCAYQADRISLTPRPQDNRAALNGCGSTQAILALGDLGYADFNSAGTGGCNPCVRDCAAPIPTVPMTWGGIKNLVRF